MFAQTMQGIHKPAMVIKIYPQWTDVVVGGGGGVVVVVVGGGGGGGVVVD